MDHVVTSQNLKNKTPGCCLHLLDTFDVLLVGVLGSLFHLKLEPSLVHLSLGVGQGFVKILFRIICVIIGLLCLSVQGEGKNKYRRVK